MSNRGTGGSSDTKKALYAAHPAKMAERKRLRRLKWEQNREKWANDEGYQKKQALRSKKLGGKL